MCNLVLIYVGQFSDARCCVILQMVRWEVWRLSSD